ncbi:MAG: methyltransferase domain-containing protein [Deltaproteobacteria bacterium]|nr:MAG: methyltransferase domain-containing protein [Deltaproteobacteria bacterium]
MPGRQSGVQRPALHRPEDPLRPPKRRRRLPRPLQHGAGRPRHRHAVAAGGHRHPPPRAGEAGVPQGADRGRPAVRRHGRQRRRRDDQRFLLPAGPGLPGRRPHAPVARGAVRSGDSRRSLHRPRDAGPLHRGVQLRPAGQPVRPRSGPAGQPHRPPGQPGGAGQPQQPVPARPRRLPLHRAQGLGGGHPVGSGCPARLLDPHPGRRQGGRAEPADHRRDHPRAPFQLPLHGFHSLRTPVTQPFADHFAPVAASYADFRPTYPRELFAWLATLTPRRDLAWDCAAGSGQASVDLAGYFAQVVATDASRAQIDAAVPHPRIDYRVAPAEASGLAAASVDLVTVAQALHWFDLPAFYAEVRRVLRPDGALAVWSYGVLAVEGKARVLCTTGGAHGRGRGKSSGRLSSR